MLIYKPESWKPQLMFFSKHIFNLNISTLTLQIILLQKDLIRLLGRYRFKRVHCIIILKYYKQICFLFMGGHENKDVGVSSVSQVQ